MDSRHALAVESTSSGGWRARCAHLRCGWHVDLTGPTATREGVSSQALVAFQLHLQTLAPEERGAADVPQPEPSADVGDLDRLPILRQGPGRAPSPPRAPVRSRHLGLTGSWEMVLVGLLAALVAWLVFRGVSDEGPTERYSDQECQALRVVALADDGSDEQRQDAAEELDLYCE